MNESEWNNVYVSHNYPYAKLLTDAIKDYFDLCFLEARCKQIESSFVVQVFTEDEKFLTRIKGFAQGFIYAIKTTE